MLVADSPLIKPTEKIETLIETPYSVFLSLDDDEENIGFDQLEDLDNEDDDLEDDDFEEDADEFEDEEEEEEDDDEDFGDEEDDDFDDEGFDDDDDF